MCIEPRRGESHMNQQLKDKQGVEQAEATTVCVKVIDA
jgi:hypothetical protein